MEEEGEVKLMVNLMYVCMLRGGQVEVESLRSQVTDMSSQLEALRQDNAAMTQR